MEFKKYGSIENSYRTKFIELMKEKALHEGEYLVQEKVHGANFSFWCNGEFVRCAKRSAFLSGSEEQNFNNAARVLKDHREKILGLFQHIKYFHPSIEVLTLCGELIGGQYPHPDVKRVEHATKVQKGVFYCPQNTFYGFDILIDGELVEQKIANMFFESADIFYAKTLLSGTFEECMKYPNKFQTHIPEWLGLPSLADNTCEGIIIRPNTPRFLETGSRVILKNKNEKFEEKRQGKDKTPKINEPLADATQAAYDKIVDYITENRLRNVLSKIGPVINKDFGKINGLFNADIVEDFTKDHDDFNVLDKVERKKVTKEMTRDSSKLIRDNFLNIIDGEF